MFVLKVGSEPGNLNDPARAQLKHDPALNVNGITADSALCPRVTIRINGFSVTDDNGDLNKTRGIGSFLLIAHTLDPTGINGPSRVGFRSFRSYTGGTPYQSGGNPTIDQQRFEFLTSTENITNDPSSPYYDGLISQDQGETKGDYQQWCSVGPWRNVPNDGMISATIAFSVKDGSLQLGAKYPTEYARYVAKRFGTHHHEYVIEPGDIDVIEQIAWHADEPFADSSALPTWHLSQLTRRHVKVALSGDGGDEMFAGYDSYRGHILSERVRKIPAVLRTAAATLMRSLPAAAAGLRMRCLHLARNIEDAGLEARSRFVAKQQVVFRREYLAGISPYLAQHATAASDQALFAAMFDKTLCPLAGMTLWQQTVSLVDDMLVKVDRMSMAHSLEVRAPFLDHRLAELVNQVKFDVKLPGGRQKYLLRKLMERFLPADFLWRRKQGFCVPLGFWFKEGLNEYIGQKLLATRAMVTHVFDRTALERLIGEHTRLKRDWSAALWALLMFESWCARYQIGPDALE